MSKNVFMRIFEEIDDAKEKIDKAIELARKGRGEALENDDLPMAKLLKEIEFILKECLEE